jgi:hypothetical protein
MAERKPANKATERFEGFTDEERGAMKARAQELKATARGGGKADGDGAVLAKIAELPEPDRAMAERLHAIIKADAAELDEGAMWPVAFALQELTAAEEARIAALVKKAVH